MKKITKKKTMKKVSKKPTKKAVKKKAVKKASKKVAKKKATKKGNAKKVSPKKKKAEFVFGVSQASVQPSMQTVAHTEDLSSLDQPSI